MVHAAMWDKHLDRVRISRQHAELHEQLESVEAKLDRLLERTAPPFVPTKAHYEVT